MSAEASPNVYPQGMEQHQEEAWDACRDVLASYPLATPEQIHEHLRAMLRARGMYLNGGDRPKLIAWALVCRHAIRQRRAELRLPLCARGNCPWAVSGSNTICSRCANEGILNDAQKTPLASGA